MTKNRVLFTLPNLMAGGAERVLITLMNNLDPEKFDRHLLVLSEYGTLRDWIDPRISFHALNNVKLRVAVPPLVRAVNKIAPDAIVSTMAGMNFAVLLARPFLTHTPKIIVREAVTPFSIIESQVFPGMVKAAYRMLYPRADRVIAPAQVIIDEFRDRLKLDTAHYSLLPNPVDVKKMLAHPFHADRPEERERTVHFIAAGRLHKQKGFDRLIAALPRLKTPYDWRLDILGAGPEEENLKNMIRDLHLERRVVMRGLVKSPWPEYAAADAFLLPSRWEGLPNVALESLACGTPVVAMEEAGGISEIARAAPEGAVTLAFSMEEFLSAMERVTPTPAADYRPSLLPDIYKLENVMKKFEAMLAAP